MKCSPLIPSLCHSHSFSASVCLYCQVIYSVWWSCELTGLNLQVFYHGLFGNYSFLLKPTGNFAHQNLLLVAFKSRINPAFLCSLFSCSAGNPGGVLVGVLKEVISPTQTCPALSSTSLTPVPLFFSIPTS